MVISESLKEKIIIIAENDKQIATEISAYLRENGFVNIKLAQDGSKIYEILRPYYNEPEQIGSIIVNEQLPQCQVHEMCMTLSSSDDGLVIPFIILGANKTTTYNLEEKGDDSASFWNHHMSLPIDYSELLIVLSFQLLMKHERFLRHKQEERLINELAERKVVDAKLKYLVVHDELTSLLNRQNFERQLRLILNRSNLLQQNGALLFIDIDRFSLINELEGFETGDRLIVDIVSIIRKLSAKNATALNAATVLEMATINGAKALGLDTEIGSLEIGKQADIVAIDMSGLEQQPMYNPISQLIYTSDRKQVSDVWVAGKQLMKDRQLKTLNLSDILKTTQDWQKKLKQQDSNND